MGCEGSGTHDKLVTNGYPTVFVVFRRACLEYFFLPTEVPALGGNEYQLASNKIFGYTTLRVVDCCNASTKLIVGSIISDGTQHNSTKTIRNTMVYVLDVELGLAFPRGHCCKPQGTI